jgi:hypothetical protein
MLPVYKDEKTDTIIVHRMQGQPKNIQCSKCILYDYIGIDEDSGEVSLFEEIEGGLLLLYFVKNLVQIICP